MKTKKTFVISIVFVIFFTIMLSGCGNSFHIKRMFSDIGENVFLEEYATSDTLNDKYINGIDVADSFCKKIKYKSEYFFVFAHTFHDDENAIKYGGKLIGKNDCIYVDGIPLMYSGHETVFFGKSSGYVVCIYGSSSIRIEFKNVNKKVVRAFFSLLNSNFSQEITVLK